MLVNLYLPALVFLYSVTSPNLRNVLSLSLPRPLLLRRPHNFHLTKSSLQWFVYFYSSLSIFQCLLLSSQNNYTNKLISVLHCMSYCTFIKFNLTTRRICSYWSLSMTATEPVVLNLFYLSAALDRVDTSSSWKHSLHLTLCMPWCLGLPSN